MQKPYTLTDLPKIGKKMWKGVQGEVDQSFQPRKISEDLKVMETKLSLTTNNTLCMNLNVTRVMQII